MPGRSNPVAASMLASFRSGATGGFPGQPGPLSSPEGQSPLLAAWARQAGLGVQDWGQVYAAAIGLPRTFDTFVSGQFSPMEPIYPVPIDVGAEPSGRPRPRRFQYPVGWNLPVGTPGTEGLKLANFQVLRDLAEPQSVTRACVEVIKGDILDLNWDIIPTDAAQKAMQGNPRKRVDFEKRRAEVVEWISNIDPDNHDGTDQWLNALLEDSVVLDAVALYIQPAGGKGNGPCGSDVGAAVLLDGATIRPLLASNGGRPRPPEPAYQQLIWGVPRVDLMDLINLGPDATIDDIKMLNPVLMELTEKGDEWSGDQLIYFRTNSRSWTPYGFGPVEQSILPSMIMQARMTWQWEFYRSGSLPSVFMDPGESIANAEEARQLQQAINMLGGDLAAMHQVIVTPPGAKITEQKPVDLTSQFDEWMTALIVMPFGLSISDLGITPKVAAMQSPEASRMAAQVSADRAVKRAIIPRAKKIKSKILDRLIQGKLGQRDMQFSWGITEQGDSRNDLVTQHVSLVKQAIETIDEARIALEMDPLGLEETTIPLVFTATGATPLSAALAAAIDATSTVVTPTKPGGKPPAGKPPAGGKPVPGKPPGGGKPPAGGGQKKELSPAEQGAQAVESSPPDQRVSSSQSKAFADEAAQLRRYLRRGGHIDAFVPKTIPVYALRAGRGQAADTAVAAVVKTVEHSEHKRRALAHPRAALAAALGALGAKLAAGKITVAQYEAEVAAALAAAFAAAYRAGARWARSAAPQSVSLRAVGDDEWESDAHAAAAKQAPFVAGFAEDIAAGMSAAMLAARANQFASSIGRGYEEGYAKQGASLDGDDPPSVSFVWHLGDTTEPCELCVPRDGQEFSLADLPGYPGDGGYGDLCMGGPMCGCTLELRYGDQTAGRTSETLARQISLGETPAADLGRAATKDFSLSSPLGSGFVPFDLETGVRSIYPSPTAGREVVERFDSEEAARRALHAVYDPAEYEVVGDAVCRKTSVPAAEVGGAPTVDFAGLAVRADDTGRVLMLQRASGDDDERPDAAAGTWEFPGGHLDDGETPFAGACREWSEEVGAELPPGRVAATWVCDNGYQGFVYVVPHETDVAINYGPARAVPNPDGDRFEAAAWFDVDDLPSMPALRPELRMHPPWNELRTPIAKSAVPAMSPLDAPPRMAGTSISEDKVMEYLQNHYPDADLGWVSRCLWVTDNVLLDDIEWQNRPGGMVEDTVRRMAEQLRDGESLHRVVLVAPNAEEKLRVADGYHRCAAYDAAGQEAIPAWVATPKPGNTGWLADIQAMQFSVRNHPADKTVASVAAKDATTAPSMVASEVTSLSAALDADRAGDYQSALAAGNAAVAMSDLLKPMFADHTPGRAARDAADSLIDEANSVWASGRPLPAALRAALEAAAANLIATVGADPNDQVTATSKAAGEQVTNRSDTKRRP